MKKKNWLASLLAVLMVFSSLTLVSAESDEPTIRLAITQDESTLTPYTYQTGYPGLELVNLIYDNLFHLDENNQPVPWLVKEYNVSEDGLTYDFTLYEGIQWQDGQPLTAEDVKFTIDYFLQYPKSRFTNPLKVINTVEVKDETSFTITLTKANPNFMILPLSDMPILPKHIWSTITDPDNATNALGSGPYVLAEYQPNQYYKFTANPNYFKGKPPVKEIVTPMISDSNAMFTALQAGQVDAISSSITPELVEQFTSNPNLKVVKGAGFSTSLLQINAEKFPMSDKAFRQAIGYAIDTQYIADTVNLGYATVGSPGFIHPESPFYNSEISFAPDMEKAKQILDEAGYKDTDGDNFREGPNGEKIALELMVQSNSPLRVRSAEIITDWLNQIGLNVKVKSLDYETVISLVWPDYDVTKGRNFDLVMFGWSATMQLFPDRLIELFYSDLTVGSVNLGAYKNEAFDKLADELKATLDQDERKRIINEMQLFVAEEMPIVTLGYSQVINAYNPNVYDGYVFRKGTGILNKLSFVSSDGAEKTEGDSAPADNSNSSAGTTDSKTDNAGSQETAAQPTEAKSSGNNSLIILLVVVVAILGGVFFLKKKGSATKN